MKIKNNEEHFDRVNLLIGENIRRVRKARGYTQKTLAEEINITPQQVQKYETGNAAVTCSRLLQLSNILDCDIVELLEGWEYDPKKDYPKLVLSHSEMYVISDLRKLSDKDRGNFMKLIQQMAAYESPAR